MNFPIPQSLAGQGTTQPTFDWMLARGWCDAFGRALTWQDHRPAARPIRIKSDW